MASAAITAMNLNEISRGIKSKRVEENLVELSNRRILLTDIVERRFVDDAIMTG